MGTIADANTLLPILATDSASFQVISLVYCRLLRYDGDFQIVGDLAESYAVLEGGKKIRFSLRKNAYWHDGVPVTPEDVLFTVNLLLDPKTPTPYKSRYEPIEKIQKIGERGLEVTYKRPFAPALESWTELYIVPQHLLSGKDILTTPLNRNPVGCGPYKFSRWLSGREIEVVRNPNYYRNGPYIEKVVFRIIPDQATMFLELKNGGIDEMTLTPQQFRFQGKDPVIEKNFQIYRYSDFVYTYLGFNLRNPLFQDVRVRRALAHAVDKKAIIDGVLFGLGRPGVGPYRPGIWYYNEGVSDPEYDLKKANDLLDSAGFRERNSRGIRMKDGKEFRFVVLTNQGNQTRKQVGEILKEQFRKVGVEMELRILEWSTFLNEFVDKGRFDAVILGWSLGVDPDQYDIWHSSRTGPKEFNFIGYKNPEVDRLLEEGRTVFDQEKRKKIYFRFQEILSWEQPYIFLYVPDTLTAIHRKVKGIVLKPAGIGYNFEEWWIEEPLTQ